MLNTQTLQPRQPVTLETPVYRLMRGQRVLHKGEIRKVARVFPCLDRPHGFHVHLLPLNYEPLPGWEGYDLIPWSPAKTSAERKARVHEAQFLIKVARPEDGTLPVVLEDWDLRTDVLGNDTLSYGEEPPVFAYQVQLKSPATYGDGCPIAIKTLYLLTHLLQWEIPELVNRCYRGHWLCGPVQETDGAAMVLGL